jgi:hypothetical protein
MAGPGFEQDTPVIEVWSDLFHLTFTNHTLFSTQIFTNNFIELIVLELRPNNNGKIAQHRSLLFAPFIRYIQG